MVTGINKIAFTNGHWLSEGLYFVFLTCIHGRTPGHTAPFIGSDSD